MLHQIQTKPTYASSGKKNVDSLIPQITFENGISEKQIKCNANKYAYFASELEHKNLLALGRTCIDCLFSPHFSLSLAHSP